VSNCIIIITITSSSGGGGIESAVTRVSECVDLHVVESLKTRNVLDAQVSRERVSDISP